MQPKMRPWWILVDSWLVDGGSGRHGKLIHEDFEWLSRLFAENMDSSKGGKSLPASYSTAGSWEQGPAQSALFGHLHCAFVSFFGLFFWAKPCYSSQSSKIYTFEIRHFLLGNGNVGYIFSLRSHPIRVPIDIDCIRWPSVCWRCASCLRDDVMCRIPKGPLDFPASSLGDPGTAGTPGQFQRNLTWSHH